jgi:hypothetical protein
MGATSTFQCVRIFGIKKMKKTILAVTAILSFASVSAFAGDFHANPTPVSTSSSANGQASGAVGAGVFATGGVTTSAVSGSFNASLNGPGSTSGSYTAGNQGFADTAITFGTSQNSSTGYSTGNTNSGNGNNGNNSATTASQSTSTGFAVSSDSGSENFGSDIASGTVNGNQAFSTNESGNAAAGTVGLVGEAGAGFGGFGSLSDTSK